MLTYNLKKDRKTPLYLGLYDGVREDIRSGVIPAGSRLPSRRSLAEHLGVSVVTVDGAYRLLVDEGYAVSRERSGYFAAGSPGFVRSGSGARYQPFSPSAGSARPAIQSFAAPPSGSG